ncbi:carboxylating nicotinate-nucleotide diphosphorylase [Corynebacterium marinum]|jgi:nicotinate-nucleotide pyrophosphorylase (carboxylating)|uniref:Nicotinate-nucleotide pyrophosphorylase [carboxylating] n=2 Tax=Corynebacterium marinum TaxID=349751 RepID=A0A0B6TGX3_9CORY|nr:carboxylating nicotinate-nucleotide diphosphorylase [Corynebacterium marinum]AJK69222.1 Nicotinate-nucleotide pyrophosphorylase [carboxylating] [Corynebacterium marinum DSM 44953]NLF91819.1 carboxylating nicotinate-nucleotide diphosphorylase [Corynebacterium marinum]GGO17071.1 putative nicotinate-nucleotide pyrophosphatase NadC [Corynebacterium marinum]
MTPPHTPAFPSAEFHPEDVDRLIAAALDEDLTYGPDITSRATVSADHRSSARIVARRPGTIAGLFVVDRVLRQVATSEFKVEEVAPDGTRVGPGDVVARIEAGTRDLLTAERTLLNLLTHLSGIATATAAWVDAVEGTGAAIRDSRKTLPGMRLLQKYAVTVGGGVNHRLGLGDRALIKDNHVVAAGGVRAAFRAVRAAYPDKWCEVEVDTLDQLNELLPEQPDEIMLDNFEPWAVQVAVQRRNATAPGVLLEASGGLSLDVAADYASTGVDYLAVGSLTHSAPALDLGLDFD